MSDGTKPMLHQAETDPRLLAHMLRIYIEDDAKDPMMMERVIGKIEASMDAVRAIERERCAMKLQVTRADVSLAAGELSAQEWRTCSAVLRWMQSRIRD